ncbi:L,D-transpeptidase [Leptolyngbya sp. AN02str]|uniref:L,D-transpeptidase n=1 Tax=Leptolyngbya sp. AN02str TaxID=3423363 RepID=UPI003D311C57
MTDRGSITRSFMVLCFATAGLLLWAQNLNRAESAGGGAAPPTDSATLNVSVTPARSSTSSTAEALDDSKATSPLAGGWMHQLLSQVRSPFSPPSAKDTHSTLRPEPDPNGFVAAVPGLHTTLHTLPDSVAQIVVDLSDRQVSLYKGAERIRNYPVAIGQDGWETPTGRFAVTDMQVNPHWQHPITKQDIPPGPGNPLGTRWIAFWSDGQGVVGFHGTYDTDLIGQAVSHGCIRMHNDDVEELYKQVALGSPVIVQP